MPNLYLDGMIASMLEHPDIGPLFKLTYPRRYVPPNGYANPKYFSPVMVSAIANAQVRAIEPDFVTSCILMVARKLTLLRVPTFFVGQEFAEAVFETRIDSTMKADELVWPDEAMLFVLPEKFAREYLGYHIPFMALAHYTEQELRSAQNIMVQKSDGTPAPPGAQQLLTGQVFMHYQWQQAPHQPCVDYVSSYPVNHTLAHINERLQSGTLNVPPDEMAAVKAGLLEPIGMAKEEDERKLLCTMRDFSVKLLMAMTAEPIFVERGGILRPGKIKHGKKVEELWSPHTIGFKYHHPQHEAGGTHASPRLHRRIGHFRDQHYGVNNASVKRLWIKPTWVGVNLT